MALLRLKRRRRGRSDGPTKPAQPVTPSTGPPDLTLTNAPLPGAEELHLSDEQSNVPRSGTTGMGFDPYSNDAGFSKPHSWERVERD